MPRVYETDHPLGIHPRCLCFNAHLFEGSIETATAYRCARPTRWCSVGCRQHHQLKAHWPPIVSANYRPVRPRTRWFGRATRRLRWLLCRLGRSGQSQRSRTALSPPPGSFAHRSQTSPVQTAAGGGWLGVPGLVPAPEYIARGVGMAYDWIGYTIPFESHRKRTGKPLRGIGEAKNVGTSLRLMCEQIRSNESVWTKLMGCGTVIGS